MKPVGIIISLVIIVFSLYMVGSSISNLQSNDKEYDAKTQEIASEINRVELKLLDLCTTTNDLEPLKNCKSISIPNIIQQCNDPLNSNLSVCSDVRLKEFSNTIDERIESASRYMDELVNKIDAAQSDMIEQCSVRKTALDYCKNSMSEIKNNCMKEELNDLPSCNDPRIEEILTRKPLQSTDVLENTNNEMMDFFASCTLAKTESSIKICVDTAQKMLELCNIDASVQACNDPRLKEIANYDVQSLQDSEITNSQSQSEQSQMDFNIQRMHGATIRGCIEDNEIFANYMLTVINLDSINDDDERLLSVYNGAERLNICSADIKEIESKYCNSFNPSCTETGKFETFWEIIPRIQSSFDQICTNTGKLCNYAFHEN